MCFFPHHIKWQRNLLNSLNACTTTSDESATRKRQRSRTRNFSRHKRHKRTPPTKYTIDEKIDCTVTDANMECDREEEPTWRERMTHDIKDASFSHQQRRLLCVLAYAHGLEGGATQQHAADTAAALVGVSRSSVYRNARRWQTGGLEGLGDKEWTFKQYTLARLGLEGRAREWVLSHAIVKGKPNLTAKAFTKYCVEELLVETRVVDGEEQLVRLREKPIAERTAQNWLHKLGFSVVVRKKGIM
eukprot:gnl/Spiro4/17589_TR9377_c0_g1_i1.p1 gnl/Spiro4/17589_TR9377_c0_g1~~gnl/Spiro4/17589_TR9377_c0_g1_i1.p1  ORF type:complete len:245 (+),score=21.75 gnl/Spiro4/17589_TR9377_c0_g1_i1:1173-1907(+)